MYLKKICIYLNRFEETIRLKDHVSTSNVSTVRMDKSIKKFGKGFLLIIFIMPWYAYETEMTNVFLE